MMYKIIEGVGLTGGGSRFKMTPMQEFFYSRYGNRYVGLGELIDDYLKLQKPKNVMEEKLHLKQCLDWCLSFNPNV